MRYLKRWKWYLICIIIIFFLLCIAFYPYSSKPMDNNETIWLSVIGLKIMQFEVFAVLLAGALAFIAALYTSDMNYKAIKLSSIPDNSINLLLDLNYLFNEYELSKKEDIDNFDLLIQIVKFWHNHQKAFLILTPHFYKQFLNLMSSSEPINEYDEIPVKNAKYLNNAFLTHITNCALNGDEIPFKFIRPRFIDDNLSIKENGDINKFYGVIDFKKASLINYIGNISGKNTKDTARKKFNDMDSKINCLIMDLKEEIEEYY